MNNFVISCCSTADLSQEHFLNRNINYICFHYEIDGIQYLDDLGSTISYADFYEKMRKGAITKTSQVNTDEFEKYFTSFLEKGYDILHISLSSGLSGVYNSANLAKQELQAKYPHNKIYLVDSLAASSGYGLIMDKLADLKQEGYSIDTLYDWISLHKLEMHHWFFSTDLSFYVRGGRISKAEGWFGTTIHLCPLLNMNNEGKLIPQQKVIGKKRVIKAMVLQMEKHAGLNYHEKCYLSHSDCENDAKAVANLIEESFPLLKGKVEINNVGTTIGSHTGPGTVALFFWGDKRDE